MQASDSEYPKDKAKSEPYLGERNYKSYHKVLKQLLSDFQEILTRFLPNSSLNTNQIDAQFISECPSIAAYIQFFLDDELLLKKQARYEILHELREYAKKKIDKIVFNFTQEEFKYYRGVAEQNQTLVKQSRKNRKIKQLEFTGEKMLKLDILSIFLKFNNIYKKKYKINKAIMTKKMLVEMFGIQDKEFVLFFTTFQSYFSVIKFEYQKEFESIVAFFGMLELKSRISNFKIKFKETQLRNTLTAYDESEEINEDSEAVQLAQQAYFLDHPDYQYRFCEIAYIPQTVKELTVEALVPYKRAQINQQIKKVVEKNSLFQQRQQLMRLKIKYKLSFYSLMKCFERWKQKQIEPEQVPVETLKDLKICQWLFLKPISIHKAIGIATKSPISPYLPYKENSIIMAAYCRLAMERLSLETNVLKAHEKIDRMAKRKSICYCRFNYFSDQFQQNPNQKKKAFGVIIGTKGSEIMFAAVYNKQVSDQQYLAVIKHTFARIKQEKQSIVVYLNHPKSFYCYRLQNLFSIRPQAESTRIYFAAYPEHFQIHLMANSLIRLLISGFMRHKANNFIQAAEFSSSIIISSLNYLQEAREILYHLYPQQNSIEDYSSLQISFKQQQIRTHIAKVYQIFCKQSLPKWNFCQAWANAQSLHQGKIQFFNHQHKKPQSQIPDSNNQRKELQQEFLKKSNVFVNAYVEQLKWRHPYLSQEQKQQINESFHQFLQKRRMQVKDLAHILKYAVRFLICYQAYFNQMIFKKQMKQLGGQLSAEIRFLRKVYEEETQNLNNIYKNGVVEVCRQYFCMDIKTGKKLMPTKRVSKKVLLQEKQSAEDNKKKKQFHIKERKSISFLQK